DPESEPPCPERPDPPAPEDAAVRAYYDDLAARYDEVRFTRSSYGQYLDRLERVALARALAAARPGPVLDLACGTGRLLDLATHGLDASESMLTRARARWPDKPLVAADAERTPFEDRSFEAVLCLHLLMHLGRSKIARVLRECRRILRPGGRLVLDFPSALRRRLRGPPPRGWHGATALSPEELMALSGPGFELVGVDGLMLLPVHRLPAWLRLPLLPLDRLLCRGPLARLASFQLVELRARTCGS
ncbi:MAG TPA: class I SAM-dependent methyltransferase, partial [Myxococcota bacterium]|nr:class I SAM-dependent methyltransferase [Myxococcota bacterium]